MNFNNLEWHLKIKPNLSSKDKSESFKPDSMPKEANLKSIWDVWEKAWKTKTEKADNSRIKFKNFPKNSDSCQFLSKRLLIMKEKFKWLAKKSKDLTEFWETRTVSWAILNLLWMTWKLTSKESTVRLCNWERNIKSSSPKEKNMKERPKSFPEESMTLKTRTERSLSMRMLWPY